MENETELQVCPHCANRVPLKRVERYTGKELYEYIDDRRHSEDFEYSLYRCPTCQGMILYGDFISYPCHSTLKEKQLYPHGSRLITKLHKLADQKCMPAGIVEMYERAWPLRHVAPGAFAVQIRRTLELVCYDQQAEGRTLFDKIKDLASRDVFPGHFAELTDLVRKVGNIGAHLDAREVDFWDAELLDDFFRSIVEYVYIVPSKIERLRQRVGE